MTTHDWILVIGAGSIGERYVRNLQQLGYNKIVVLRHRNLPFRDIGEAKPVVVTSWEEVDTLHPVAAIICTPTSLHLQQAAECINRGMHVLIEKPLSHNLVGIDELKQLAKMKRTLVAVGYMMRYYPLLKRVKEWTTSGRFGKLLYLQSYWGEYLPDWHPWEDYRASYAARKELGGGVALTLSHDLDVCNWMVSQPLVNFSKSYNSISELEVDVESGADFLLSYRGGVTAHVHLNFFQKTKIRYYHFVFTDAVVRIDFFSHTLTVEQPAGKETIGLEGFDRNDLFVDELKDFFGSVNRPENAQENIDSAATIIELCI